MRKKEEIYLELQQQSAKAGFLQFQIERAMPTELEKIFNNMMSLQKEIEKIQIIEQEAIDKAKESSKEIVLPKADDE